MSDGNLDESVITFINNIKVDNIELLNPSKW
jgi:hypothetical protein